MRKITPKINPGKQSTAKRHILFKGAQMILANTIAETAPEAPKVLYPGLFLFFKNPGKSETTRADRQKKTNTTAAFDPKI